MSGGMIMPEFGNWSLHWRVIPDQACDGLQDEDTVAPNPIRQLGIPVGRHCLAELTNDLIDLSLLI